MKITKKELITSILLIALIVSTRTVFHLGQNIEFITAAALSSAILLKNKSLSPLIVLFGLLISDLIIGNSAIFIFTWSGFIVTTALGYLGKNEFGFLKRLITVEALGIISTAFFFLWTNFGVVVMGNMYSKDISGLIQSYINGLPFLRNQLFGNLIIVPIIFTITFVYLKLQNHYSTNQLKH